MFKDIVLALIFAWSAPHAICMNTIVNSAIYEKYDLTGLHIKDVYLIAKIVNAESYSEGYLDKMMTGSVVLNRVTSEDFPDNITNVIYQKNQFDGINTKYFLEYDIGDSLSYESFLVAIHLLKEGPINSANYFINPKKAKDKNFKKFLKSRKKIANTLNHVYYE